MATTQQQFCVRWNSYQSNLQNAFPKLLTSEHFVDVTLACESEMIKCHKVVLSACSTYFEKLLVQNPCQHPIIFMKDMRFAEMQALVDFMYKGEVNVTQDELPSLLRSAEALQIRGLCGSDQLLSQHYLGNLQNAKQQQQTNKSNTTTPATANGVHSNTDSTTNGGGTEQLKRKITTTADDDEQVLENGRADKREATDVTAADTASIGNSNSTHSTTNSTYSNRAGGEHEYKTEHEYKSEQAPLTPTHIKDELYDNDESYYDNDGDLIDTEYLDQDLDEDPSKPGTSGGLSGGGGVMMHNEKSPDFAIANVSCQYNSDCSPGGGIPGARRIRRSEAELRRAAECITRGQTFQTVSDQFNIPISTIRFYMARKGILPRRKRGRACSTPGSNMLPSPHNSTMGSSGGGGGGGGFHGSVGNSSPVGPPYHIVHYKLPSLGAKLK